MEIYKLKPAYLSKLWGGQMMEQFGYDIPKDKPIGEAWVISAHPNGMSYLADGPYKGMSLKEFFEKNRNLFGNYQGEFPLLAKVITAKQNLSVQVHPDDAYAKEHNHSLGKPESWYIMDAPKNAEMIYGHTAKTEDQLKELVEQNDWLKLLKKVPVSIGDFMYVDAGKIHAILAGITVYELERNSDVTYRFYDWDRVDPKTSEPRHLDIKDSLAVTKVPDEANEIVRQATGMTWSNAGFSLYVADTTKDKEFIVPKDQSPYWLQWTVVKGEGTINGEPFKMGESAIAVDGIEKLTFTGDMKILISWINH